MITVAKATSAGYYTSGDGNGGGAESYYLDAVTQGEPPGRWLGTAAAALGLSGEVSADDMEVLFEEFINPVTGQQLGNRPAHRADLAAKIAAAQAGEPDADPARLEEIAAQVRAEARTNVIGWDLTFSVPKSVTVLHTAASRGQIAASRAGDQDTAAAFAWIVAQIDAAIADANTAGLAAAESVLTARAAGGSGAAMRWERALGSVVASFFQHTNRSIDPHLHVHNVMLNKVPCADGKWRAIDGQDLLAQRYAFSAVADRALVEGLTRRVGTVWIDRPDGAGKEAALVSEAVIEAYSTRRRQVDAATAVKVEAFEQTYGREPTDLELSYLKTYAQRESRDRKAHQSPTADELNDGWVAHLATQVGHDLDVTADQLLDAVAAGYLPADLTAALPDRPLAEPVVSPAAHTGEAALSGPGTVAGVVEVWSPGEVIGRAVAGCAERSATWGRANLALELERNLPVLGIDPTQVQEFLELLTDRALASPGVVQVAGADAGVYAPGSAALYAGADTLAAEAALRAAAVTRGRYGLDRGLVAAWLDAHAPTIGADQRAAVEGLASSDAAVAVLVGPAGTGKSFAAGALAGVWADATGGQGRVIGLAVSQVATTVLRDDGIGLARNIDKWLTGLARLDAGTGSLLDAEFGLRRQDVVLVDEASMVATRDLEAIRARVDAAGARLVLTGDPHQLGPVQAGGAMGLLDGHAETYTLTEVRRFTHDWERAASLAVRDGAPDALDEYDRHARLVDHPTVPEATAAAARAAVADRVEGRSTVVVAATNEQAAAVAAAVRDQLIGLGLVAADGGVALGRDANTATTGDVIACRRNDYTLGVTNRVQYTVLAGPGQPLPRSVTVPASTGTDTGTAAGVVPEGALLVAPVPVPGRPTSGPVLLPAEYVGADVQLGYASTVHAAQGLTVDTAHLVAGGGTGLDPATLYVGMTRGRDRNTAHVALTTPAKPSAPAAATGRGGQVRVQDTTVATSARAVLQAGLDRHGETAGLRHRPGPGTAATVAAEREAAHLASMATITAQLDTETRAACRARLETHLDDLTAAGAIDEATRARLGADQATEHLSRLLRALEHDGRDPAAVLAAAVTGGRSLAGAESPAQVLSYRITRGRPDHDLTTSAPRTGTVIPAGIPAPVAARLTALHDRAAARTEDLGRQVAEQAPDWAVLALGPVPDAETEGADRVDWERRAGLVAAHREAVGDTHPTRALDQMPGLTATERRAAYAAAWDALGRPEPALTEAAMTDARLHARIRAWDREQAWAPPNVDPHLHAAETALDQARTAAALAHAEADHAHHLGDHPAAARLREQAAAHQTAADTHAAAVHALTAQAELHTAWVTHTAVTRDLAERAHAAAEQRGLHPTDPASAEDVTTAGDWLAAHAAHTTAEDAHRPITETDLTDQIPAADHAWNTPGPHEPLPETTPPVPEPTTTRPAPAAPNTETSDVDQQGDGAARSGPEIELLTAGASLAAAVLADRASHDHAHHATTGEDLALQTAEAGRHRRELADLDPTFTTTTAGAGTGDQDDSSDDNAA